MVTGRGKVSSVKSRASLRHSLRTICLGLRRTLLDLAGLCGKSRKNVSPNDRLVLGGEPVRAHLLEIDRVDRLFAILGDVHLKDPVDLFHLVLLLGVRHLPSSA
jgi:hypothetical protein